MYTYDEVIKNSTEYFNGDSLAAKVFADKYALRHDNNTFIESSPVDMHKRMADEFSRIEKKKFKNPLTSEQLFEYFDKFNYIIPQGSQMFGIGNDKQSSSLSNCYVIESPVDSYGGILKSDQQIVQISKRRGGVGIDISKLRPNGTPTNNAARSATGIVSWMERYSNSIKEVAQCLARGSKVLTQTGLKNIEDVQSGDYVWTKEGWIQNIETLSNGKKKVFKLTTSSGYEVSASEDHIFQTFNDKGELTETRLSDLNKGDNIVLCVGSLINQDYVKLNNPDYKNCNNKPSNCVLPEHLTEELAYVLGFSYGNGNVEYRMDEASLICLSCSNAYPHIKDKLDSFVNKIFGYNITYTKGDGDVEKLSIGNKTITQFLKHNELLKQKAGNLIFPERIIQSNSKVQIAFLSGYFDADGYASGAKKGYCFASIDVNFLKKAQLILSSIGIVSKIHVENREKQGWNDLYSLTIVGKSAQSKFVSYFAEYSEKIKNKNFIAKRDCWLTPFKAQSFNIKKHKFSYCPDNSQFLSKSVVEQLMTENESVNCNLLQDTISSIEENGEAETYDLKLQSHNLFWCNGLYVHNCGRRGALMISIDVKHPDIEQFISIKNDPSKVNGANISVRLCDEFMTAVNNNTEFQLRFPVDSETPTITRMVNAKELWNKIIHCAWLRAEPGLLFWDNIIKYNAVDCYKDFGFETVSTNPCCFSKNHDVFVITNNGVKEIKSVTSDDLIWVDMHQTWAKTSGYFNAGTAKIFKVTLSNGEELYITENHKLAKIKDDVNCCQYELVQLKDLTTNDKIVIHHSKVTDFSFSNLGTAIGGKRFGTDVKNVNQKVDLLNMSKEYIIGFMSTYFSEILDYNNIINTGRINLHSINKDLLKQIRYILNVFGISSEELTYTNDRWNLIISGQSNLYKFNKEILLKEDINSNKKITKLSYVTINYIEELDEQEIGCIEVEDYHYFTANSIISGNSELPLCVFDSCRLMVQNLYSYVKNPFSDKSYFDLALFSEHAKIAQRLMDDVIDLEIEKIDNILHKINNDPESEDIKKEEKYIWEAIKQKCINGRRTGLGITAIGDTLAALGLKYGSEESIRVVDEIQRTQKLSSYRASCDMAKELGAFPVWNWELEKDSQFLLKIKEEDNCLYDDISKYGRRNIANLTIAPTGSVSLLTQTTSGIEPLFMLDPYIRRKKINVEDKNVKVDFVDDNGDKWQEFKIYHPKVKVWMDITGKQNLSESPWYGCTANEIDWQQRVKLQAAAQKHVDHAISSTINLPENVSEEMVSIIYMTAYLSGCKGITVYRDKCRSGVLVTEQAKPKVEEPDEIFLKDKIIKTHAPKRPKSLKCDIYHTKFNGEEYFVIVGLWKDNMPYEVFAGKNGMIKKNAKEGQLVKVKRGNYSLILEDDTVIPDITQYLTDEEEAITRLVSLSLRHGCDINFTVHQLEKVAGKLYNFSKVLARLLKKYIKDGVRVSGESCPNCGSNNVRRMEGCVSCMECGWSKC